MLIDVPKDVQQQLAVPDWDVPMAISGYMQRLPQMPSTRVRCPCHFLSCRTIMLQVLQGTCQPPI